MAFNWRREPTNPYLPADGSLAQMYSNDMNGYRPLQLPVPKTPNELAADAAQSMAGYTRNNMDNYRPNIMGDQVPGGQQPAPDLEGYGQSLQAASDAAAQQQAAEQQALQKQQRIKEIEAEIAEIEQRIAERKRGMSANEDALNTQLAAIEARKINQKDPTAIWRWKAGMDAQKAQRAEDLARIEAEKQKTEKRNKELNQYKIESILKNAMPSNARTRDELTMMDKNLNDAEELAKQYGDTEMLKRIDNRRQALRDHVPVSEKANEIESDFIKEMSMVGKVGGRTKAQFVEYVTDILEKNPDVWRYNPALQQKLYQAIGTNTKNTPRPTLPQET